ARASTRRAARAGGRPRPRYRRRLRSARRRRRREAPARPAPGDGARRTRRSLCRRDRPPSSGAVSLARGSTCVAGQRAASQNGGRHVKATLHWPAMALPTTEESRALLAHAEEEGWWFRAKEDIVARLLAPHVTPAVRALVIGVG